MSLYEYSMLRYSPSEKMFDVNKGKTKKLKIFTEDDSQKIYETYRRQMKNFLQKQDTKKIQDLFNQIVNDKLKDERFFEGIVQNMINQINNTNYNEIYNIDPTEKLTYIERGTIKLDKTKILSNKYKDAAKDLAKRISTSYDNPNKAESELKDYYILNGALNKLRGDIFETFVTEVFNAIQGNLKTFSSDLVKDIRETLITRSLSPYAPGYEEKSKNFRAKVTGADLKESLKVQISGLDNEVTHFTISGSQGKTDIAVKGLAPKDPLREIGFSAKNYSGSTTIHILGGANIVNLITDWPNSSQMVKNLALNGLSAKSIYNQQFQIMKNLFLIQGLAGLSSENIKAEVFIINKNTIKDPIVVFSTYDLLFNNDFQGNFDISSMKPIEYSKGGRTYEQFINFINSAKISISTQLSLAKMQTLYGS